MLSTLRLGSDGYTGNGLPSFTNRRLSENRVCRTVFVTAFSILLILYHVREKKSNVFSMYTDFFIFLLTNSGVCG